MVNLGMVPFFSSSPPPHPTPLFFFFCTSLSIEGWPDLWLGSIENALFFFLFFWGEGGFGWFKHIFVRHFLRMFII